MKKRTVKYKVMLSLALLAMLSACSSDIWNASDLAKWVRERAVEQGCERDSIELEDWYREAGGEKEWHGRCSRRDNGKRLDFAVNVDKVWKPSGSR